MTDEELELFPTSESALKMLSYVTPGFYDKSYVGKWMFQVMGLEYDKRASGMAEKMQQYKTYPQIRTFAIENHTSPQTVRLRSAPRGTSTSTWYVNSGGYVGDNYASWAFRCAPACWLC